MAYRNVLNPDQYHGFTARPPFFEGWYYKLVSADEHLRYAIIPGVYLAQEDQKSHCFIQVFDSEAEGVQYHRYPLDAFNASTDSFELFVGESYFSAGRIDLVIDDDLGTLKGRLAFDHQTPWPVRWYSPGAMGWFAWVPFMECYHGVVSMDHTIMGQLRSNGLVVNFDGGRGYIEKDWGKQFPSAWIWGQSNHFPQPGLSLMLSVAVIPWLGGLFGGFIIGWHHEGVLHRFATYNRSKIQTLKIEQHEVNVTVCNPTHRLHIRAERAGGSLLQAPTLIEMDRRIVESLNASLSVRFEEINGRMLYEGTGRHAGLEVVGDGVNLTNLTR